MSFSWCCTYLVYTSSAWTLVPHSGMWLLDENTPSKHKDYSWTYENPCKFGELWCNAFCSDIYVASYVLICLLIITCIWYICYDEASSLSEDGHPSVTRKDPQSHPEVVHWKCSLLLFWLKYSTVSKKWRVWYIVASIFDISARNSVRGRWSLKEVNSSHYTLRKFWGELWYNINDHFSQQVATPSANILGGGGGGGGGLGKPF